MNRREFLKLAGILSGTALITFGPVGSALSLPVEARSGDTFYRGTRDGRMFISTDARRSWQLHTDFGQEYSVRSLSTASSGQIHAQLEFAGHAFKLTLAEGSRVWRTI